MKLILTFTTSNKIEFHMASDLGFPRNGDVPIASKRLYKRLGAYGLWAGKGLHPTTPDVTQGLLLASFEWQPSFNLLLWQTRGFNDKLWYRPFVLLVTWPWKLKIFLWSNYQCQQFSSVTTAGQDCPTKCPDQILSKLIFVFYVKFSGVYTYLSL